MNGLIPDNEPTPATRRDDGLFNKALRIISYPVSAFVGFWFVDTGIRRHAYENTKSHGAFTDINEPYKKKLQDVGTAVAEKIKRGEPADLLEATSMMRAEHKREVIERMEKLGLKSFSKKWEFTQKFRRQEALINGFTAAGITLGSLLVIANSKALSKIFIDRDKEKKRENTGPTV